jgi:hypothetical protein
VVAVVSLLVLIPLRTRWRPAAPGPDGAPGSTEGVPVPRGSAVEEARRSAEHRVS